MARTDSKWKTGVGGAFIQTISPTGYDVLINGVDKYLNFGSISGETGYGFRDNAGVMEFKDSSGAWAPFGTGGGTADSFETVSKNLTAYDYVIDYTIDGDIDFITYDLGGGMSIIKTFNYTSGDITSIVLSDDTPAGISLTKTITYAGGNVDNVVYS